MVDVGEGVALDWRSGCAVDVGVRVELDWISGVRLMYEWSGA